MLDKLSRCVLDSEKNYFVTYQDQQVVDKIFKFFKGVGDNERGEIWLKIFIEILARIKNGQGRKNPLNEKEKSVNLSPDDDNKEYMVVVFTPVKGRHNMIKEFETLP